ncbi:protein late bloomer [Drosophila tropicalis]|uniref:protein late bloomer n=1 Tax=Drosophila tropicalis TaxID=46794 RepID=UPI0035ABCB53
MSIIAILLVIRQSAQALRIFIVPLFLASWVQFMLIMLIVMQFPIVNEVSKLRRNAASLKHFESKYLCCGEFGPNDYIKNSGKVPSSCYKNQTMRSRDMHVDGCLTKTDESSTPVRIEMLTPIFQRTATYRIPSA